MNSTEYPPSGLARWGWLYPAVNALFVLLNLACLIVLDGGWLNWFAVAICTASGIYTYLGWRREIRDDASHRAYMAEMDARIASLRGLR